MDGAAEVPSEFELWKSDQFGFAADDFFLLSDSDRRLADELRIRIDPTDDAEQEREKRKQIKCVAKAALMISYLVRGGGRDVVKYSILSLCNWEEAANVCVACGDDVYSRILRGDKNLLRRICGANTKYDPKLIAKGSGFLNLSYLADKLPRAEDFLTEYYSLYLPTEQDLKWWKLDEIRLSRHVPLGRERDPEYHTVFNPQYSIAAVAAAHTWLQIFRYSGPERDFFGQVLYTKSLSCVGPEISGFSWSPDGLHLLVETTTITNGSLPTGFQPDDNYDPVLPTKTFYLFRYLPDVGQMQELELSGGLRSCGRLASRHLWLGNDSFLLPPMDGLSSPIRKASILIDSVRVTPLIPIASSISEIDDYHGNLVSGSHRTENPSGLGQLFAAPFNKQQLFFVVNCFSKFHSHFDIGVASRATHKLVYLIKIPGRIVSLAVHGASIFVAYTEPTNNYRWENLFNPAEPELVSSDFQNCPLHRNVLVPNRSYRNEYDSEVKVVRFDGRRLTTLAAKLP